MAIWMNQTPDFNLQLADIQGDKEDNNWNLTKVGYHGTLNQPIVVPSGKLTVCYWKMAIEILDLPIKNGVFPYSYVNVYQRVCSQPLYGGYCRILTIFQVKPCCFMEIRGQRVTFRGGLICLANIGSDTPPVTTFVGFNYYLVGGFNPSEKYESQLGWLFPIYGKNETCSKPPTSYWLYIYII